MNKVASTLDYFRDDLRQVLRLKPFARRLKWPITLSIVLGFLSSLVETLAISVIMFFIFKSFIDDNALFNNEYIDRFFAVIDSMTGGSVILIWAIIFGTLILKSAISGGYQLVNAHIVNTMHHRIRTALFEKYMSLPYKTIAALDYGTMTNALQVECWYVSEIIYSTFRVLIIFCTLAVYIVTIAFFSWPVALLILVLGMLSKALLAGLHLPLRRIGFDVTAINEELTARMYTRMQSLKTIRAHGLEQSESRTFADHSNRVAKAFTRMSLVETYIRPVNDAIVLVVVAIVIMISSAIGNPVTVTATIVALLYRLQPHLYGLETELINLSKSQGPLRAVLKQLDAEDIRTRKTETMPMPRRWHRIRFENVSFAYGAENILTSIDFELHRGQVLAIRGKSGIGKSTLVNLFLKLTEPTSGKIWLDDVDFGDIKRQEWLAQVAAAGQDFEIPDGTLRENLTLARDIPDVQIDKALQIAEIKDFVDSLPDGLHTRVGERGVRLSGGQRQRIVLARALASDPDILIMDEATSAVSKDVEGHIFENIKAFKPDMTVILITHRDLPQGFVDTRLEI